MLDTMPQPGGPLKRLPSRPVPVFTDVLIPLVAVASGLLLALALPDLIGAATLLDYLKCAVIAVSAAAVHYGVNRLAIERGALQAAIGASGAGVVSVGSVLAVGAGLYAATYAGFTIGEADRLRLEAYGAELEAHVAARRQGAEREARVLGALGAVADDLDLKASCERAESCLSGRGSGGAGPVSRAVSALAQTVPGQPCAGALPFGGSARIPVSASHIPLKPKASPHPGRRKDHRHACAAPARCPRRSSRTASP